MAFHESNRRFALFIAFLFFTVMILSSTAALAWFMSGNTHVSENTSGVSAKVTPNLVISSSSTDISQLKADGIGVTAITIDNSSDRFTPATHYKDGSLLNSLSCPVSDAGIDRSTGLLSGGVQPSLESVIGKSDGKSYYKEYTVYIASTDVAIENTSLTVSLVTSDITHSADDSMSWKAASVDFYLGSVLKSNFKGTLNLAGLDAEKNDGTEKSTICISLDNDTVPNNKDGCIALVLHYYFDGALCFTDASEKRCFVNSDTVNTEDVKFDILITDTALSTEP